MITKNHPKLLSLLSITPGKLHGWFLAELKGQQFKIKKPLSSAPEEMVKDFKENLRNKGI